MTARRSRNSAFSLIELMIGMVILGVVLLAIMGVFTLFQKSATRTTQFAGAQQNARIAVDFLTEYLRLAGSGTDYVRGQPHIVHAGPYQVGMNADIDNGETLSGDPPLVAIDRAHTPNTVPAGGTVLYSPNRDFRSAAETVMLTLDSNSDGVVSADDHGDDAEEHGENKNLLLIKKVVYGSDESSSNQVRESSLALVRGPNAYPDGSRPIPLFQYYYDHDEDEATPYKLWGDDNPEDGSLSDSEIGALTPVPANLLGLIRKVRVTVLSESNRFDPAFEAEGGFVSVRMNSEVYIRNSVRVQAVVYGEVFYDVNGDGLKGPGENGLADVDVAIVGLNRAVKTSSNGAYSIPLGSGTYTVEETDPAGYVSTTSNTVSVTLDSGQPQRVDFGDK